MPASGPDLAERLGLWLNAFDAMKVHAAHQPVKAAVGDLPAGVDADSALAFARAELQRVHAVLLKSIAEGAPPPVAAGEEADAAFTAYRQRYIDQQRQMALRIAPLRSLVRQAMGLADAPLRQLAALDAAMDDMLASREHKLLATVPALLQRRFDQLREAHQQRLDATGQPDDPVQWRQPGGWLNRFAKTWEQALLAELEVRLEPVMGLMEAVSKEAASKESSKEVSTCP